MLNHRDLIDLIKVILDSFFQMINIFKFQFMLAKHKLICNWTRIYRDIIEF